MTTVPLSSLYAVSFLHSIAAREKIRNRHDPASGSVSVGFGKAHGGSSQVGITALPVFSPTRTLNVTYATEHYTVTEDERGETVDSRMSRGSSKEFESML